MYMPFHHQLLPIKPKNTLNMNNAFYPWVVESSFLILFPHPFPRGRKALGNLTPNFFFCHTIFDIYISRAFQWYKERLIWTTFFSWTFLSNIWDFVPIGTLVLFFSMEHDQDYNFVFTSWKVLFFLRHLTWRSCPKVFFFPSILVMEGPKFFENYQTLNLFIQKGDFN